jgi:hypothetical protein
VDLVSGGPVSRPADGEEYPLNGGLHVATAADRLAVIAPEVFSANVEPDAINLTLIRSPFVAQHRPTPIASRPWQPATDQGRHEFDLVLAPGFVGAPNELERAARQMLAPPLVWDLTG